MSVFRLYSHFPGIGVGIRSGNHRGNGDNSGLDRAIDNGLLLTGT